jgi:dipeptidase E
MRWPRQSPAGISNPAYAIDDQTAIRVTQGKVDLASEGHWKQLRA